MQEVKQDWSQEYHEPAEKEGVRFPKLKILDGEQKELLFVDEGRAISHPEYGAAILFNVKVGGEQMVWFVSKKKFSLLREIAHSKPLVGKSALVTRIGTGKADTRWSIKFKGAK